MRSYDTLEQRRQNPALVIYESGVYRRICTCTAYLELIIHYRGDELDGRDTFATRRPCNYPLKVRCICIKASYNSRGERKRELRILLASSGNMMERIGVSKRTGPGRRTLLTTYLALTYFISWRT